VVAAFASTCNEYCRLNSALKPNKIGQKNKLKNRMYYKDNVNSENYLG
jgi:hypothetical protein